MVYSVLQLDLIQSGTSQVQFFTVETLFTAAGITTAVVTVTSVLHSLVPKLPARWFALGLSIALTLVGVQLQMHPWTGLAVCVGLINALVIYAAAVGVNNVLTSPTTPVGANNVIGGQRSARWWT